MVFVVVKARVFHCERGLGALRQACRRGVAMVGYMCGMAVSIEPGVVVEISKFPKAQRS